MRTLRRKSSSQPARLSLMEREPFDVSLEEAQTMVMTARVLLGWVDPTELEPEADEAEGDDDAETEEQPA